MAKKGSKWLKMAVNTWNAFKGLEIGQIAQNASKFLICLKLAQNCKKMAKTGQKWLKIAQNFSNCLKIAYKGSKWLEMCKIAHNG